MRLAGDKRPIWIILVGFFAHYIFLKRTLIKKQMNEQNDLIDRLNKLQLAIQRACPKVEKKTQPEKTETKKSINQTSSKKTKITKIDQEKLGHQFENYLLEQKLYDTIKKIMLTKNLKLWRKRLGRKVLLRGLGNQNTYEKKPKQKKKSKSSKKKKIVEDKPVQTTKVDKEQIFEEEEENTDAILDFANKIIQDKKNQMKNFEDGLYSPHLYEKESSQPNFNETSALFSDETHNIKNPFLVTKTLEYTDSDDEFLHNNSAKTRQSPMQIEDVSSIEPKSENISSGPEFTRLTKPADLSKAVDRVLTNKEILQESGSSNRSVSSSIIFDSATGKAIPKFSFKNDNLFALPPSDQYSQIPSTASSNSSTKVPSYPGEQSSTASLIHKVNKVLSTSSGTDKFDSLVDKAHALLMDTSGNNDDENDIDDNQPDFVFDKQSDSQPSREEKIVQTKSEEEEKVEEIKNETPINSAQSTPSKSSILDSPQPISPESSKNESIGSTELKNNSNSMIDSINVPSEDEDIAEFERRISALTSSSRAAVILDEDGEVGDVDSFLKAIKQQLNKPSSSSKFEPVLDDDDDEQKIDMELAALQKSLRRAIDSSTKNDEDYDFDERMSKLINSSGVSNL